MLMLIIALWLYKWNVLGLGKYTLKYLGLKEHNARNWFSDGSEKWLYRYVCVCTYRYVHRVKTCCVHEQRWENINRCNWWIWVEGVQEFSVLFWWLLYNCKFQNSFVENIQIKGARAWGRHSRTRVVFAPSAGWGGSAASLAFLYLWEGDNDACTLRWSWLPKSKRSLQKSQRKVSR